MINYNILANNIKRGIVRFCSKLSVGLNKPTIKFINEMIYGILASQSCYLTDISRKLNEKISLKKTVERLSRNLMNFDDTTKLINNYLSTLQSSFDEKTVFIIDDSDISKPYSKRLEGICKVRDGSTGLLTGGYWTAGVSALTSKHKQPIPVYNKVYSSLEDGYTSNNTETIKALAFISNNFSKDNIRAFDRGYDAGIIFDYLIQREEMFIIRSVGNRHCVHKGKKVLISTLSRQFRGKHLLKFTSKKGLDVNCKISIVPITLPSHPNEKLNLVICNGFGKDPLMLITNLTSDDSRLCVTVTKVYLMRWRIEEYYRFKKQAFGSEKFLVRSLSSIRNLDLFLSIAIGYIGLLGEKVDDSIEVTEIIHASKRLYGIAKFMFYSISDGLFEIFSMSKTGLRSFFQKPKPSLQMTLYDCR